MARRHDGPFTQSRGRDGRFGRRERHECPPHRSDVADLAIAAGLGGLIVAAGFALHRWWTGKQAEQPTASPPSTARAPSAFSLSDEIDKMIREGRARADADEAKLRVVSDLGRQALAAHGRAVRTSAHDPEEVAQALEDLAHDLRRMEEAAQAAALTGVRLHIDDDVWSALMEMKQAARNACVELKERAMANGIHDFPRYRQLPRGKRHPTLALLAETTHQMEHAMALSAWYADARARAIPAATTAAPQLGDGGGPSRERRRRR